MDAEARYWQGIALALADDVISLARDAGMPDSFQATDVRMQRARNARDQAGTVSASPRATCPRGERER